jgi:MoaA/NifB/PqqE/SkfB family radical SAM enzyme
VNDIADSAMPVMLTAAEQAKRNGLKARKPYVAAKLAKIAEMEERGEISPIVRLEKSYLCNFQCSHCSAEFYMDRHLERVLPNAETPYQMNLDDVRRLSREADELGLARFVITGGEPLVMKDLDAVVEAIDPEKHYVVTDTNGWFLDSKKAHHLKSVGIEKVQLSLDSFVEADHDRFRNKPGSYRRVMRAIDASLDASLNLILSTVLVKGRAKTAEFEQLCRFCAERGIGLYVSYAKPTGACSEHPDLVIDKTDADAVRELETRYPVFTHMTPSYGSFKGCITVKGIITVTSAMEVKPCPYIDFSLGNLRQTSLKEILARGMRNPWLGPYRPDCLIGEDAEFIRIHTEKTEGVTRLPVPWGEGFSDHDRLPEDATGVSEPAALFDQRGRCRPQDLHAEVVATDRGYYRAIQPALDYDAILRRSVVAFGADRLPNQTDFRLRAEAILSRLANRPELRGVLDGVRVPFLLPQEAHDDLGAALEEEYLPRVASAYQSHLPDYRFVDHHAERLAGRLAVVAESRHGRLVQAMAADTVVGWYFPCLSGYSIPAALERAGALPAEFSLAGGYDTCAALIGSPDLLVRHNGYPPLLWLAALTSERPGEGLYFEAYGRDLTFNRRMHSGLAAEYWNSGLVLIG